MRPQRFYGTSFLFIAVGTAYLACGGGWWATLAWPSAAFLVVSGAYFAGSPRLFGKQRDGRRAAVSSLVLLPYLLLTRLLWEMQTRMSQEPLWHVIDESLTVARRLRASELPTGVTTVVDLTAEMIDPKTVRALPGYRCLPLLDAGTMPPTALIELVRGLPNPGEGRLLIHCANGHGRTGTVAAAWLIFHGIAANPTVALERLQSQRPLLGLRRFQRASLDEAAGLLMDRTCATLD
jgi:protein-tyrosine phosphatase